MRQAPRDVAVELKSFRLHGMASAWGELMVQGGGGKELESSRWLVEHLLQAENVDRHMRSICAPNQSCTLPHSSGLNGV